MQRTYLWGLEQDGVLSYDSGELPDGAGPTIRADVDAGTDVIDLASMRAELEAERASRRQGEVSDGV